MFFLLFTRFATKFNAAISITLLLLITTSIVDASPVSLWSLGDSSRPQLVTVDEKVTEEVVSAINVIIDSAIIDLVNVGDAVSMPTLESGYLLGVVKYKNTANNEIAGKIDGDGSASFRLAFQDGQFTATLVHPDTQYAYQFSSTASGETQLIARDINDLLCFEYPATQHELTIDPGVTEGASEHYSQPLSRTTEVPILSSRLNSENILYLDFDGEYVVHPSWNGGEPIDAQPADFVFDADPSSFSEDEILRITKIWEGVAEDYALFDVNVTTDRAEYDAAQSTQRQQIIITSTNWYSNPTVGTVAGVAYVGLFSSSNDTPAWSFYFYNTVYSTTVVSHELGHALGLFHDGLYQTSYHPGTGYWGPIMGAPTGNATSVESLVTWSNGDYAGATNTFQDDIDIMGQTLGFVTDLYGNDIASAKRALNSQSGIIGAVDDLDVFYVRLKAGQTLDLTLDTFTYIYPNLDSGVTLKDSDGTILAVSNPEALVPGGAPILNASIQYTIAEDGVYYIEVEGVGCCELDTNYSKYGSVGNYTLNILEPAIAERVEISTVIMFLLLI